MQLSRLASSAAGGLLAFLALTAVTASPALAQTGVVQGLVVDAASMRPLSNVQILVAGTGIGQLTNSSGRYVLLNVPAGEHTVQATLIGFDEATQTVTVTAGQTATADIQMASTAISLNEIVVTGVGAETTRRALGTSVEVLAAEDFELAPVQSVDQLLQGRVAGATVNATSAQPGTGSLINFRGVSSVFGAQTPVIYVDGVRVDNDQSTAAGTGGEQSSALADILVSDIERIEVTKGGAASTLFGSDAATGVIQIFTKKGTPGGAEDHRAHGTGNRDARAQVHLRHGRHLHPSASSPARSPSGSCEDLLLQERPDPELLRGCFRGDRGRYVQRQRPSGGPHRHAAQGRQHQLQPARRSCRRRCHRRIHHRVLRQATFATTSSVSSTASAIRRPADDLRGGRRALHSRVLRPLHEALDIFLLPRDRRIGQPLHSLSAGVRWNIMRQPVRQAHRWARTTGSNQQRVFQPIGFTPGRADRSSSTGCDRSFTSVSVDAGT